MKMTHLGPNVETAPAPLLATSVLPGAELPVAAAPVAEVQPTARPGIHERNLRKWLFQH